jgi:hypothetical protein
LENRKLEAKILVAKLSNYVVWKKIFGSKLSHRLELGKEKKMKKGRGKEKEKM